MEFVSLEELVKMLIDAGQAGNWLLLASVALWALFAAANGKLKFQIPFVSAFLLKLDGRTKAFVVVLLGLAACVVGSVSTGGSIAAGIWNGVRVTIGAMGIHGLLKALTEKQPGETKFEKP